MDKSESAYKTIGEVAKILKLQVNKKGIPPTHIIRFWETQFKQIKPKILSGNRRYYSKKDIVYLKLIYTLLKNKGFTINGAKKALYGPSLKLDDSLFSSVNKENCKFSFSSKVTGFCWSFKSLARLRPKDIGPPLLPAPPP